MAKQPKKKTNDAPVAPSGSGRTSGKPHKKHPKVFDPEKRRLVTKKN